MIMDVYVANAFSKDNRGGNKAGVVLQQARLNEAEKQKSPFLWDIQRPPLSLIQSWLILN